MLYGPITYLPIVFYLLCISLALYKLCHPL